MPCAGGNVYGRIRENINPKIAWTYDVMEKFC